MTNIFTVDLEDWFHVCGVKALSREQWGSLPSRVESTTRWLLDTLDASGVRATFFVLGWIAEQYPELVAAVRSAGHDIGSHGHDHLRAYDLTPEAFARDVRRSVSALNAAGVPSVTAFRAPEWSINDRSLWALETLAAEGFGIDASMAPVRIVGSPSFPRHPHVRQTASGNITEVPPLVADRFGQSMPMGWGWGLRMSSPRRVLRRIEEVNRTGVAAVLTDSRALVAKLPSGEAAALLPLDWVRSTAAAGEQLRQIGARAKEELGATSLRLRVSGQVTGRADRLRDSLSHVWQVILDRQLQLVFYALFRHIVLRTRRRRSCHRVREYRRESHKSLGWQRLTDADRRTSGRHLDTLVAAARRPDRTGRAGRSHIRTDAWRRPCLNQGRLQRVQRRSRAQRSDRDNRSTPCLHESRLSDHGL